MGGHLVDCLGHYIFKSHLGSLGARPWQDECQTKVGRDFDDKLSIKTSVLGYKVSVQLKDRLK